MLFRNHNLPKRALWVLFLAVIVSAYSCRKQAHGRGIPADAVLVNGQIITVDSRDSIAEALAVRDGKIVAVGLNKAISPLIGEDTQVIDLQGMSATPGLIDSHCHFSGTDLLYNLDLSYPAVKRIDDVLEKIKAAVVTSKPGGWIQGYGWDEGKLAELRYLYAADLDLAAPNNPVWLTHTTSHYGVANSYALRLAKINKMPPNPPAGTIDRYPDGKPTGVLKESAQSLVLNLIPEFTSEQEENGLRKIIREFNAEGMTAVKDPGVGMDKWAGYQHLLSRGELNVRVFALWAAGKTVKDAVELISRVGAFTKPYVSTGDDKLISGGIKLFLDGSGGGRTAWLYGEWNKNFNEVDRGNYGYPVMDPDAFRQIVRLFHDAGIHICTHAVGDKAIDWVIDSYADALKQNPQRGLRHGIIHCNIPTDRAIVTIAEMQKNFDAGYPEAQATFTWWIGDTYAGNFGADRCRRLMPFKTYLNKGIMWAGGSDYNVTPFPARYGIWASITRSPLQGIYGRDVFGSEESIDVHAALRSYTIWSAHQLFLDKKTGSLEAGKYADIAVWDKNPYLAATDEIKNLRCQMTILGGKIVYQAPESRVSVSKRGVS